MIVKVFADILHRAESRHTAQIERDKIRRCIVRHLQSAGARRLKNICNGLQHSLDGVVSLYENSHRMARARVRFYARKMFCYLSSMFSSVSTASIKAQLFSHPCDHANGALRM